MADEKNKKLNSGDDEESSKARNKKDDEIYLEALSPWKQNYGEVLADEKNKKPGDDDDEESFKTRNEEEDDMYLKALMKEAQGGGVSKVTTIKSAFESPPERLEEETAEEEPYEEPEEDVVEEFEEELAEEAIEEEPEVPIEIPGDESSGEDEGSKWEDPFEEDDSTAIKKYIFGVSLDYVDLIDEMNLDERSAFINDAIYIKLAREREDAKNYRWNSLFKHIMLMFITAIIGFPLLFWVGSKSVELTFENYRLMQKNFETLVIDKAKRDATIRSTQEKMQRK